MSSSTPQTCIPFPSTCRVQRLSPQAIGYCGQAPSHGNMCRIPQDSSNSWNLPRHHALRCCGFDANFNGSHPPAPGDGGVARIPGCRDQATRPSPELSRALRHGRATQSKGIIGIMTGRADRKRRGTLATRSGFRHSSSAQAAAGDDDDGLFVLGTPFSSSATLGPVDEHTEATSRLGRVLGRPLAVRWCPAFPKPICMHQRPIARAWTRDSFGVGKRRRRSWQGCSVQQKTSFPPARSSPSGPAFDFPRHRWGTCSG